MIRRPPRSTRTDTLFPYTTLFRSGLSVAAAVSVGLLGLSLSELFSTLPLSNAIGEIAWSTRSEEHTSELQSLMRISYAVFCLKKKKKKQSTISMQRDNIHRPTNYIFSSNTYTQHYLDKTTSK